MEKEDERSLIEEMLIEDLLCAFPVISRSVDLVLLNLVLLKVRNEIAQEERKETAKVDEFVHDKGNGASDKQRIAPFVKLLPLIFQPTQLIWLTCSCQSRIHCINK